MKRITISTHEPVVGKTVHSVLRDNGFVVCDVDACVKPELACDCDLECCTEQNPPDLMILDVLVDRDCTGVEFAQKALRRWPAIKVLLMSATPPEMWPPHIATIFGQLPSGSCKFLPKPFTASQLRAAIRELLGRKTVLLAEDDAMLRYTIRRGLESNDFRVIEAFDGMDALELAASHQDGIDVVVSDYHMPRVDGVQLLKRLKRRRPGLAVILMSGTDNPDQLRSAHPGLKVLRKPFEPEALNELIRELVSPPA